VRRYIGLDLHKAYVHGYVWQEGTDNKGRHLRFPSDRDGWAKFIKAHVDRDTWIAIEATGSAFHVHDILAPYAGKVVVVNSHQLKRYGDGRHSDKLDAERLAHMLALGTVKPVWVPPEEVRALRSLLYYRQRLVGERTRTINRARAILREAGFNIPRSLDPWRVVREKNLELSRTQLVILHSLGRQREHLENEIDNVTGMVYWSLADNNTARRLISLPGVGPIVAAALIAHIGDAKRFKRAKQVVRYAGLDASIHQSGEQDRRGRISKNGPPLLPSLLVQAAFQIVRTGNGPLAAFYQRKVKQIGTKRAIVALARKLLVAAWRLMQSERLAHEVNLSAYRRALRELERVPSSKEVLMEAALSPRKRTQPGSTNPVQNTRAQRVGLPCKTVALFPTNNQRRSRLDFHHR